MGLKDWVAKNVAGAGAYGDSMGRSTAENGLALGRTLYVGHGISEQRTSIVVFDDAKSMLARGFKLYCTDSTTLPPSEDSSQLSLLTRAAGVAFAARVAMNVAQCFRTDENTTKFRRSLGASNAAYVGRHSPDLPMELVMHFVRMDAPKNVTQMLDLMRPGSGDLLGAILLEISRQLRTGSVGFRRTGVVGFDTWATSLAEQTVTSIQKAAQQFGW